MANEDSVRYGEMWDHINEMCNALKKTHGITVEPVPDGSGSFYVRWSSQARSLVKAHKLALALARHLDKIDSASHRYSNM
jgi:hypothetical protein